MPRNFRHSPAKTITAVIIARLEAGTRPWVQPWTGASVSRPLRACGTPYQGLKVLWLWMAAEAAAHSSPFWMTYRQSQLLGGQVRKGERGTVAIFYRTYRAQEADGGDEPEGPRARRVLKSFIVFNACQIDGLPERFFPEHARSRHGTSATAPWRASSQLFLPDCAPAARRLTTPLCRTRSRCLSQGRGASVRAAAASP